MYYALIGIIAIILHIIINFDVLSGRNVKIASVTKDYRHYLNSVLVFYVVDMLWGILSQTNLSKLLYVDTMAYYASVAVTVIFWCKYVSSYLNLHALYSKVLLICGFTFATCTLVVLAINSFSPIIFDIDKKGHFAGEDFRLVAMVAQVIIFSSVSIRAFYVASQSQGRIRRRYFTVSNFGLVLTLTVFLQYFFPLVPLYAMGLLTGTCLMHVFVQEDEKAEIKKMEIRNANIIQALAQSYEQLNYISMDKGTYTATCTSYDITVDIPELRAIQERGNVSEAIGFALNNLVSAPFRKEMAAFSDLSTVDSRMAMTHLGFYEFKNFKGIWYEWDYIVVDRNPDGKIKHLIWAVRKIEDEKQAEIRKQKILEENIAANKAKTKFLQNMTHEIRTPLNAMFGFAQLLGMDEGTWTAEERAEYNNIVLNSYRMMDMLIGDVLDVSDSEHGNYRINIADVHVNEVCRNALSAAEFRRPVGVESRFTTDLPDSHVIRTDGLRVQQVLINYLTNACKHTTEGEIVLHCTANKATNKIIFTVTDTGEGIPEDKADLIFKRFTKLDQYTQGSGLGLNICQMVADKLGGKVYLDKTYKTGARFVFEIDDVSKA